MRAWLLLSAVGFLCVSAPPSWAAKLGETCDGLAGIQCDAGMWCEHPAGQCDMADGAGKCVQDAGPICTEGYLPVCGCDGVTYSNDCKRQVAKAQLDHPGECGKASK
jgi:hypothetical protein